MTTETLMTDQAATTTEGQAASTQATDVSATGAGEGGQQQSATEGQGTQAQEASSPEGEQPGAPEKYDFAAPEGREYDPKVLDVFSEAAKELNLPQDKAQQFLDKLAPAMAERQAERLAEVRTEWAESAKADKEFGGDKFDENVALAKKALDTFGTPEFVQMLNETGLGNNPEMIRVMYRAGKAISEDRFVGGQKGQTVQESVAQRMYPNMNP